MESLAATASASRRIDRQRLSADIIPSATMDNYLWLRASRI